MGSGLAVPRLTIPFLRFLVFPGGYKTGYDDQPAPAYRTAASSDSSYDTEVEDVEEVVMTRSGRRVRGGASTRRRQQQGSADRIVCFDYEDELGMPGHR